MSTVPLTRIESIRDLGVAAVLPGDDGWDRARQAWLVNHDQRPAAVVVPESVDDVIAVVGYANRTGLRVAPQSTGHNAPPLGDLSQAVLVKMERMRAVEIRPEAMVARAEAGCVWEDVVVPAADAGYAVLHGSSPDVGVAGYMLGGGVGWLARKHVLATNSLTAVELVTPAGEVVRADPINHAELFWALRGGGGNFGIVTALEFRMFEVPHVFSGWLIFPWERTDEVMHAWARWTRTLPEEVTSVGRVIQFPDIEPIPEPMRGRNVVVVEAAILADEGTAAALIAPLRELGPEMDTFAPGGVLDLVRLHQDPEGPTPALVRHVLLDRFDAETVDAFVAVAGPTSGSPVLSVEVRHVGGAAGRPAPSGGAMSHLDAEYAVIGVGIPFDADFAVALDGHLHLVADALAGSGRGRQYLNFTEEPTDTRTAFTPDAHRRLLAARDRLDPARRMRADHPIVPAV